MKIKITENQLTKLIKIISEEESRKLNVLFVGDSLSSGKGYSWNYLLEASHPEWNVNHVVYPGKRTDWMLENLEQQLNKKQYDLVFIYGGTNDMFSLVSINTAISNIQKMVDLVVEQGGKAYVYSGYDVEAVTTDDVLKPTIYCDMNCMIKSRNRLIEFQDRLSTIKNAVFIPPVPADKSWSYDGIHLRPGKDAIVRDYVEKYIQNTQYDSTGLESSGNFIKKLNDLTDGNLTINSKSTSIVNMLIDGLENILNDNIVLEYKDTPIKDFDVFFIKVALQLLGDLPAKYGIDSKFGLETEIAIKEFQKKSNLDENGTTDNKTVNELIKNIKKKNLKDIDLKKIQLDKTESFDYEELSFYENGEFDANVDNSISSKFRKMLDTHNISYSDFVNDANSIGLNPEIAIAQLHAESGFAPDVINCSRKSSAGAMGLAQFMPTTWGSYGGNTDPCNPKDALKAYFKLMKHLMKMFPERIDLALAGYNHGPYRQIYSDALKNNTPFERIKHNLPLETRNYVQKILKLN